MVATPILAPGCVRRAALEIVTASFLPGPFHSDPADSLTVATAREMNLTLLTRDAEILAYGEAGNVKTQRC